MPSAFLRFVVALSMVFFAASFVAAAPVAKSDAGPQLSPQYAWPHADQLTLDGPWSLAWTDPLPVEKASELPDLKKLDWFAATVPTEVHWALHRAGKSPNPYVGLASKDLRWVEGKTWWFRRTFTVPEAFQGKKIHLVFDGVDYYARYWLNGRYLGRSEGAFGAVNLPVENIRFDGENELVVRVDCAGYKLGRKGGAPWASLVKSELWSGWDVGARDFNTVGIWQPVRLVAENPICLERPFVRVAALNEKTALVRVNVEVVGPKKVDRPYRVAVTVRGRGFETKPISASAKVGNDPIGLIGPQIDLLVPDPKLWWPNGLGDQPMYEAEIVLTSDGKTIDKLAVPFGIRTIERKGDDPTKTVLNASRFSSWRSDLVTLASRRPCRWTFNVNGRPMFVKGVNWMPIDVLANVAPEDYEWNLRMARDAGVQMIRIWGGGILESDSFYDICDRLGLMVWQEFPLTCGWTADKIDRKVWEKDVLWNIFRLRNHPSLAFWCGGNEFPADHPANFDLVAVAGRAVELLDGTRDFMAASPYDGDIHGYPQWDASNAWRSELIHGPFISEWGSHAMPTAETLHEVLKPKEADALVGPTLLTMNHKLAEAKYPELIHHWVEFQPDRLPQMLNRASAFDHLAVAPLNRFCEAVAAGSAEFYKYSCEAARVGYPNNGGLMLWVWKRPWPIAGIQIIDGLGRPLAVYYDVKRAYSSPWPCLAPPHLNYVPGEKVTMPTYILTEATGPAQKGLRLSVRLVGNDLKTRQIWKDFPAIDTTAGSESTKGPAIAFDVPKDSARSFFFVVVELADADGRQLARNAYTFRCPPQLEDAAFCKKYRQGMPLGLGLTEGPWLRPHLETTPTTLTSRAASASQDAEGRWLLAVEVKNTGTLPAVMTQATATGKVCSVADDAFFWLEPGETRTVHLRLRTTPDAKRSDWTVIAKAWNAPVSGK